MTQPDQRILRQIPYSTDVRPVGFLRFANAFQSDPGTTLDLASLRKVWRSLSIPPNDYYTGFQHIIDTPEQDSGRTLHVLYVRRYTIDKRCLLSFGFPASESQKWANLFLLGPLPEDLLNWVEDNCKQYGQGVNKRDELYWRFGGTYCAHLHGGLILGF
ncbi:hypothetical protein BU16DRAFT_556835 [Lophium mytilinum]|uniref:Uncharacterized protein n=1 Tax=Lophium mytilinum TaxID=390894 RepID=A0A6A6R6D1_9PEZI|nr:hypothetical protein BU16DRAFT_556835 [Lophium mytilinum]